MERTILGHGCTQEAAGSDRARRPRLSSQTAARCSEGPDRQVVPALLPAGPAGRPCCGRVFRVLGVAEFLSAKSLPRTGLAESEPAARFEKADDTDFPPFHQRLPGPPGSANARLRRASLGRVGVGESTRRHVDGTVRPRQGEDRSQHRTLQWQRRKRHFGGGSCALNGSQEQGGRNTGTLRCGRAERAR